MRTCVKAVVASILFAAVLLDGPALAQMAPVDLGGEVAFEVSDFAVDGRARRRIVPRPFTAAEILTVAPKSKIRTGPARRAEVLVHNDRGVQWVGIDDYVAGLNSYELFLNNYGYTLRDGPLGPQKSRPVGDDPVLQQLVVKDLGLKFRLKSPDYGSSKTKAEGPWQRLPEKKVRADFELFFVPEEILGPNDSPLRGRGRGDDRVVGWRVTKIPTAAGLITRAAGRFREVGIRTIDINSLRSTRMGADAPKLPGGAVQKVMSICPPSQPPQPEPCKLVYGANHVLSAIGQTLFVNPVVDHLWTCTVSTSGTKVRTWDNPCVLGDTGVKDNKASMQNVFYHQDFGMTTEQWAAWKNSFKDVCKWQGEWKSINRFVVVYDLVALPVPTGSEGKEDILTGTVAANFYDGMLKLKISDLQDCFGESSENGWFSAYACTLFDSDNSYDPTNGFRIKNGVGVDSKVGIFGLGFTLLEGTQSVTWKQATGKNATKPLAATPTVVEPTTNSSLNPLDNSQTFKGPSAVIPIGPVPLSISSSLTASMHLKAKPTVFAAPAITDPVAGKDILGVGATAGVGVHVNFDAAIDIVVASAGVEGELNLIKTAVDGDITSTIDTGANEGKAVKTYTLSAQALSGNLNAFVEIDLLVYTKRWSIELASFDGADGSKPTLPKTWTAKAILPEGKICP